MTDATYDIEPIESVDPKLAAQILWWLDGCPHGFGLHTAADGMCWRFVCASST